MNDLFDQSPKKKRKKNAYTAQDIEVLEGLEPVRRRPGMYIGGTDENAMHHLVAEVFDNAMDEAVAGHASTITLELKNNGIVTISDNGRGIPTEPHPKFPKKSALEVIMTTLHSGGKFSNKIYHTAGGLHGVGLSVVNALSEEMRVEVYRERKIWMQEYKRGNPINKLKQIDKTRNVGSSITFKPDHEIFGEKAKFKPARLYKLARSKAYLFQGVKIKWKCAANLISGKDKTPIEDTIHFPNGLVDYLNMTIGEAKTVTECFHGVIDLSGKIDGGGKVEWAVQWSELTDAFTYSYCNTIPTPQGGTHENGFRNALVKGIRAYAEMVGNKKARQITTEDLAKNACIILSVFLPNPEFQGQTKEKLTTSSASKMVELAIKDHLDHWLSGNKQAADALLNHIIAISEERINRKQRRELSRKTVMQKLRLPGKLADCTRNERDGTEIFLVEGDSAGGSAKQARNRETQAVLPLRGKILNVASAAADKISKNQELNDLSIALGCGSGQHYSEEALRYDKVIIMTDADVDGAHIASLLMTYFYIEMPELVKNGHLYLAQPPLYRISQGDRNYYVNDDKEKADLLKELEKNKKKIEIGRFKGLGEMMPKQLKETTMSPKTRQLLQINISDAEAEAAKIQVENLMGRRPELRFQFIQEQTANMEARLAEMVDV